jgi:SNF2-related domain
MQVQEKVFSLREYQIDISIAACELLKLYKIAYLNMQVRTGKTLTALETAKLYHARKVLFVTKKKAISSIEKDYEHYKDYFEMTVTNYEQLSKIHPHYDLIIVDEAHSLGAYPKLTERAKQLKRICHGQPIIYLSGTPSPESYSQLFHQFYISSWNPFGISKFTEWAKTYVNIKKKYFFNREMPDYSDANIQMINDKVGHLFKRMTQEDAGFEQLVDEKIHVVEMQKSTYNLVKKMKTARVHITQEGQEILADTEVKLMSKLHQIYSGTVLAECGNAHCFDMTKGRYIFEQFKDKKIAVFYKFGAEKTIIFWCATAAGKKITSDPEEFNANGNDYVFVSQIVSGREGVNLSSADCLIMYNIDFSALSYWQSRSRMQSKDRKIPSLVYWIFAKDGIEHQIYKAVSNKKNYTLSYFKKDSKQLC